MAKKEIEKPSKVKIDIKFDKVRDSINDRLDSYNNKIDAMRQQVIQYKQQGNNIEARRIMERIKQTTIYRHKTMELMDRLEQFQFMIDESFSKMELYSTVGEVMSEVTKINMSPEVKGMLKDLEKFEKNFTNQFKGMDQAFGFITDSINNVDQNTKSDLDLELEAQVAREMQQIEEDTDNAVIEMQSISNWG